MKHTSFCALLAFLLILALAPAMPPRAFAQGNGISAENSETPVGPVTKNRPPAPSGHTVKSTYPEGFLTISEPSVLRVPDEKAELLRQARRASGPTSSNIVFIVGAITAIGLFMAVAWIDHAYRARLQSIISQNNRLLNGEDVDLIGEAPVVGIPLFLGTQEAVGDEFGAGLKEYLDKTADDLSDPGATA
ncbi:MAG: hypothetical protein IK105_03345 [Thermoguttaceae bacterium]|nr:hypothetical protein [Thermoguttaceae bacterium]MBR5414949.1 hypothetical protein [Thermoguttaceae bacterium]MCR5360192.1 hypothetical protein [Thermoguttaceae bacterium]